MGSRSGQWAAGVVNGLHLLAGVVNGLHLLGGVVNGWHVLAGVVNGWQEWSMGGRSGQWVASLRRSGQWVACLSGGGPGVAKIIIFILFSECLLKLTFHHPVLVTAGMIQPIPTMTILSSGKLCLI